MTRRALLLVALPAGVGLLVAVPAGLLVGPRQWAFAGLAFGLCVPPGVVTLVLADYLGPRSPFGGLLALMVGTAVRLVVGFGGALAVVFLAGVEDRADRLAFLAWVLGAYLTTLVAETVLLAQYRIGRTIGDDRAHDQNGKTDSV